MVRKYLQGAREIVARLIAWLVFRGPVVVTAGRARMILDPKTGRLMPVLAGGEETPEEKAAREAEEAEAAEAEAEAAAEAEAEAAAAAAAKEGETDWKAMARKHERRAKAEKQRADDLAAKQKEIDDAAKSEHEKAVDAAREEGRTAALTEAQKERRADRLELDVTRLATRGVKVGDGDDAKTFKFADPDDALAHVQRAIRNGDVDEDDIFDENGKVKKDGLTEALAEILDDKPHLRAGTREADDADESKKKGAKGGGDGGKGKGGGKTADEMSPDDHLKAIQGR